MQWMYIGVVDTTNWTGPQAKNQKQICTWRQEQTPNEILNHWYTKSRLTKTSNPADNSFPRKLRRASRAFLARLLVSKYLGDSGANKIRTTTNNGGTKDEPAINLQEVERSRPRNNLSTNKDPKDWASACHNEPRIPNKAEMKMMALRPKTWSKSTVDTVPKVPAAK